MNLVRKSIAVVIAAVFVVSGSAFALQDLNSWRQELIKKVQKTQVYPRSAIAKEIEGRAKIRMTVAADGKITSFEVTEPTGEKVLDREIPKFMKRLDPLPALPEGRETLTFTLPLTWSLG